MQRFKQGQQVVCTHPTGMWLGVFPGPKMNDIVTVSKYSTIHKSSIELVEYNYSNLGYLIPDAYIQIWFEPIADINELTQILEESNP